MPDAPLRFREAYVRITPVAGSATEHRAAVWSDHALTPAPSDTARPSDVEAEVEGLAFRGVEPLLLQTVPLERLVAAPRGDRATLASGVFARPLAPALDALLRRPAGEAAPARRVWWHADAPALDLLPWEQLAVGAAAGDSLVRGRPTAPRPRRPLERALSVVCSRLDEARALAQVQGLAARATKVATLEGIAREARAGTDVLHLAVEGVVTRGGSASLRVGAESLSLDALERLTATARAFALVLTPARSAPDAATTRAMALAARHVTSASTAYAASAPTSRGGEAPWEAFYRALVATTSLEDAVGATRAAPATAMVLHLRHRLGREFEPATARAMSARGGDPMALYAELERTRRLLARATSGEATASLGDATARLRTRVEELERAVAPWTSPRSGDR